jgi:hypothetical protein
VPEPLGYTPTTSCLQRKVRRDSGSLDFAQAWFLVNASDLVVLSYATERARDARQPTAAWRQKSASVGSGEFTPPPWFHIHQMRSMLQ